MSESPLEGVEQKRVQSALRDSGIVFFDSRIEKNFKWAKKSQFAGFPDILVLSLAPINDRPTAIEMKRADRDEGSLSSSQEDWRGRLLNEEWNWVLGLGCDSALDALVDLGYEIYEPAPGPKPKGRK